MAAASGGQDVPPPPPASGGLSVNAASALCYLLGFITGVLFLLIEPYSRNRLVRFHAFQSIFSHAAVILIWFLLGRMRILWPLVWLASVGLWLYLMVSAWQGRKVVLPVVGRLAEQQA